MGLRAVKILGINITISSKKEILEYIEKGLEFRGKSVGKIITIVTPNPEQIVAAQQNFHFAQILNQADVALPDGGGIVWAHHMLSSGDTLVQIPGVEFVEDLVAMAAKRGAPIALIGGRGDIAVEALECLTRVHPGLVGVALTVPSMEVRNDVLYIEGYSNSESYFSELARTIAKNGAKMIFVGLGAPKQEMFVQALTSIVQRATSNGDSIAKTRLSKLNTRNARPVIFMSVGGSFDIIAGRTPRAPAWVRRLHVPLFSGLIGSEFIWRLFHEPWRIGRQLALVKFVWLVLKERYTLK